MAENSSALEPLPQFPSELKHLKRWVRHDKDKVPLCSMRLGGRGADGGNPDHWDSLDNCVSAGYGLGFEFFCGDHTGFDVDCCVSEKTGEIAPTARDVVKLGNSYAEISVSGTGIHIFFKANPGLPGVKEKFFEAYSGEDVRYFACSGKHLSELSPPTVREVDSGFIAYYYHNAKTISAQIRAEMMEIDPEQVAKKEKRKVDPSQKKPPASEKRARLSNQQRYHLCMTGRWQEAEIGDGTQSAADLFVCGELAKLCNGDSTKIDLEFRKTPMMREKWDERHGAQTYGEMTIAKALENFKAGVEVPELVAWELHELLGAKIPPREALATLENGTPILTSHSINQVFAWRGSGKTLLCLSWAIALACGADFLCYKTARSLRMLYVEGELPDAQLQERLSALVSGKDIPRGNFTLLSRDKQIALGIDIPSIHTVEGRLAIERLIDALRIEVLFLDSMSSLLQLGTNDEESWLGVLPWLTRLRSRGLCVTFLQQTGKNQSLGTRGHSRSEDPLDLSIKLTPHDEECDFLNCKLEYTKIRAQRRGARSLNIQYKSDSTGWYWSLYEQDLLDALRLLLEDDPKLTNIQLAKELDIGRNKVAKLKKRLGKVEPKQSSIKTEAA